MFEFSFTGKPVFLYASDMKEYDDGRGFYFDYASLPYDKAENMEQLENSILEFNSVYYEDRVNGFFKGLVLYEDGLASKTVADKIMEVVFEQK